MPILFLSVAGGLVAGVVTVLALRAIWRGDAPEWLKVALSVAVLDGLVE